LHEFLFKELITSLHLVAASLPVYCFLRLDANAKSAADAKESEKMDFKHADRADPVKLNVILWKDAMGDKPVPAMLLEEKKGVEG
jgi:hypothetical protein